MKKKLAVVMAVVLSFALTACSTGKNGNPTNTEAVAEEKAEPSESVTLYITRHGKTMLNTTGRMQGWSDSPLTDAGAEVAAKLGKGLKKADIMFDGAYSSDSGRAVETAEIVLQNKGQDDLDILEDKNIREVCYGIYEGATPLEAYAKAIELMGYDSIEAMMGDVMGGKIEISDAVTAMANTDETGTAETWENAQERISKGFTEIAEKAMLNGQETIFVVSHGMAISSFVQTIDSSLGAGELANASITKVVYDGENFTVETVNDTSYIEE